MDNSQNKRQNDFTPLQGLILFIIIFLVIIAIQVIKKISNLSFGWSSPELGILFVIIIIAVVVCMSSEEKKSGQ